MRFEQNENLIRHLHVVRDEEIASAAVQTLVHVEKSSVHVEFQEVDVEHGDSWREHREIRILKIQQLKRTCEHENAVYEDCEKNARKSAVVRVSEVPVQLENVADDERVVCCKYVRLEE